MAERVVDCFEAVQVEIEQAGETSAIGRQTCLAVQDGVEDRPVRQAGELVVMRQEQGAILRPLALGDVEERHHNAVCAALASPEGEHAHQEDASAAFQAGDLTFQHRIRARNPDDIGAQLGIVDTRAHIGDRPADIAATQGEQLGDVGCEVADT